ncbi:hypothetical protein [uncultured Methanobrevibacter sp.]
MKTSNVFTNIDSAFFNNTT